MNYSTWLRVRVVLRAAPTYIVLAGGTLAIVADELAKVVGADSPVVVLILRAVSLLGAAVAIIRRVTPTLPDARGILPTGEPVTSNEAFYAREMAHLRSVLKDGG